MPSSPATGATEAAVDKDIYLPGQKVTATVGGFGKREQVQTVLFSEPTVIGNFTADKKGDLQVVFPVAESILPGSHTLQFTGWCGQATATAVILVGSAGTDSDSDSGGIPPLLWWAGGGLSLAGLGLGGWRLVRLMRSPLGASIA